jgi:SAM-dependent methyltransferase
LRRGPPEKRVKEEPKWYRRFTAAPHGVLSGDRKGKGGGWPLWLWVIGGFAVLVCAGRLFDGQSSASARKKKSGGKGKSSDTAHALDLAMRLQQMTEVATALSQTGEVDTPEHKELEQELKTIEEEVDGLDPKLARDLLSMASIIRGTLTQTTKGLTDEQVEEQNASYTYANPRYWDDYYNRTTEEERFDWYGSWDTQIDGALPKAPEGERATQLGQLLRPYLDAESKILMLGCGNSDMSEKMYRDGLERIVNVDISESLLANLRSRLAAAMPRMSWQYEDASKLSFDDGVFDATIEKGTLDAIEQNKPLLQASMKEAHRTLKPGGFFLSITFNAAPVRVEKQLLAASEWGECTTHEFSRPGRSKQRAVDKYFLHACQKRSL